MLTYEQAKQQAIHLAKTDLARVLEKQDLPEAAHAIRDYDGDFDGFARLIETLPDEYTVPTDAEQQAVKVLKYALKIIRDRDLPISDMEKYLIKANHYFTPGCIA